MKKPYEKILGSVQNTLLSPFEEGISPDQVKQTVLYLLTPYFNNLEILHELAAGVLVTEAVNLARISQNSWAKEMFVKVLSSYRTAYSIDKRACVKGCVEWYGDILNASSEYVSISNLSSTLTELSELTIKDFSYTVFRNLGALIEACFQPYLKELLLQIRISCAKQNSESGLREMALGAVVNELCNVSNYSELLTPKTWNLKLHQWRNISQHHNTHVENGKIIATYKISGSGTQQSVSLTREELLNLLKQVDLIFSVIRGAHGIFVVDSVSVEEFKAFANRDFSVRSDVKVFWLASSLATQGFELKDISISDKLVFAVIKDVMDAPLNEDLKDYKLKRMIHSTQFIYSIWFYFPAKTITIEHLDKQDSLKYLFSGRGNDCEKISREELPFEDLSKGLIFCSSAQSSSV